MDSPATILYEDQNHKCIMFSFDDETDDDRFLSINQYLVIHNDEAILSDPGSAAVFDEMYDAVSEFIDPQKIRYIFFSHQDPDVAGSITEWSIATSAKIIFSKLWVRFMQHYGLMDLSRVIAIPDEGQVISLGGSEFHCVPAHFMHSPGNFTLYDATAKIIFTGDIGAAISPLENLSKNIEDFDQHLQYLEPFHIRYMGSNKACRHWIDKLSVLDIEMMAPQHGAVFNKEQFKKFTSWLEQLQCGIDLL